MKKKKDHSEFTNLNRLDGFQSNCNYYLLEAQIVSSVASGRLLKLAPGSFDRNPSRPWTLPHHLLWWQDSRVIFYISSPSCFSKKCWFLFMRNVVSRPQSGCQGCSLLLSWLLFLGLFSRQMLERAHTRTHTHTHFLKINHLVRSYWYLQFKFRNIGWFLGCFLFVFT